MAFTATSPARSAKDHPAPPDGNVAGARADWRDARYQAFNLMRLTFTVAPIAFGIDKFANLLFDWPDYLAPWINDIAPGTGQEFMYFVGAIEILAGEFRCKIVSQIVRHVLLP